jgi:predicted SAM-dependent methyltransferase
MRETSKTLRLLTERELAALSGKGLDIGAGDDPVRPDVQRFDVEHGDANRVTSFVTELESFDYVYSSHCLEHMHDPAVALADWWKLVKPGGTMMVIVPDEDLYEQGYWPSIFNSDHKATFTVSKQTSWSALSRNMLDLARALPNAEIVSVRLMDQNYKRSYVSPHIWSQNVAAYVVKVRRNLARRFPPLQWLVDRVLLLLRLPMDQTNGDAVAQNIMVVAKTRGRTAPDRAAT